MEKGGPILERIYSTFGDVAKTIGYSPIHGKIIAALAANSRELTLTGLARETGYSISMISLSLDLLEVMGIIKKTKKPGDRNLYIILQGDLLETLKKAIVMRTSKSIKGTLTDLENIKKEISSLPKNQKKKTSESVRVLEKEIKRLEKYINILSLARLP